MPIVDPLDSKGNVIVDPLDKPAANESMGWGKVAASAVGNLPASAGRFVESVAQPFMHPIETAKGLGNLGLGLAEKAIPGKYPHEKYADAVAQFFKDRYGGVENLKKTIATDPVGVMADLSVVLTGGGGMAARAPGMVGKVGEITRAVGEAANPLTVPIKAAQGIHHITGGVGNIPAQLVGGVLTHTGTEGIKGAFQASKAGGAQEEAFLAHMRDPEMVQTQIVPKFRNALNEIRKERSLDYQKGMQLIGKSRKILDFKKIDEAVDKASRIKSFKGTPISELAGSKTPLPAEAVHARIKAAVAAWKKLDPAVYHTPEGVDALKQYVGDIKNSLAFNTPERKVAEEAYGAIRNTIAKQEPEYDALMKDYNKASDLLSEMERTLSLGKKSTTDTALRKLLSATRSNVNTNFGYRYNLAKQLSEKDPTLIAALSGQSVSPWFPQGLGRLGAGGAGLAAFLMHNPHLLAAWPFMSPRVWGEAVHGMGKIAGKIPPSVSKVAGEAVKPLYNVAGKIDPELLKDLALKARAAGGSNAGQ